MKKLSFEDHNWGLCRKCGKFHKYQSGMLGKKHTGETKEKIRTKLLGKKLTEEHKRKISVGNKGKKRTEEQKLNYSIGRKKFFREHPEERMKTAERTKKQWGYLVSRERMIKGIIIAHQREYENYSRAIKIARRKPESRQKQSENAIRLWKDPVFAEKTSVSISRSITAVWRTNKDFREKWWKAKLSGRISYISEKEKLLVNALRKDFPELIQQKWIGGRYYVDIFIPPKLVIEVDGDKKPPERDQFIIEKGFEILHFWNNDVEENLEECVSIVKNTLQKMQQKIN